MADGRPQIAVVGGGFVGLSFAIAAGESQFSVAVYDAGLEPGLPSRPTANVIALNPRSIEFLDEIGVWSQIPEVFVTGYDDMQVFDGSGTGQVSFSAEEAELASLGAIVDQQALRYVMAERAATIPGVECHWGQSITLSDIDTDLVVAADGANSKIREEAGLHTVGHAYDQEATVALIETELPHRKTARQWFLESGPLAFLPISDANQVAMIWSSTTDLSLLSDEALMDELQIATEDQLGRLQISGKRFNFPLQQKQALQYVKSGVALLGDAAHAIHPLAGQGANLGFADARSLVTELAGGRLEGKPPGDVSALRRYEKSRRAENHAMGLAMEAFHRLFTSKLPLIGFLRNQGMRFFHGQKSLKRLAIAVASGRV